MRNLNPRFLRCVPIIAFLGAAGCGGRGDVNGKVTFNGKPVVAGTVVILASDSLPYTSEIEPDGSFMIEKVPTGLAQFAVVSRGPSQAASLRKGSARRVEPVGVTRPANWFPLPDKFADPTRSGIESAIVSGPNSIDIPLTGDSK